MQHQILPHAKQSINELAWKRLTAVTQSKITSILTKNTVNTYSYLRKLIVIINDELHTYTHTHTYACTQNGQFNSLVVATKLDHWKFSLSETGLSVLFNTQNVTVILTVLPPMWNIRTIDDEMVKQREVQILAISQRMIKCGWLFT